MCRQWASQDRVQTDTWGPPPVQTGAKHSTQVTPQAMNSNDIRLDLFCQIMFYLCFLAHIFCIPLIGFHKLRENTPIRLACFFVFQLVDSNVKKHQQVLFVSCWLFLFWIVSIMTHHHAV